MALEYTIRIGCETKPQDILTLLQDLAPLELAEVGENGLPILTGPGVAAIYAAIESPAGREIIAAAFGFTSSVYVLYRLEKDESRSEGVLTTIKTSIALLKSLKSNGVLLFEGETVVFVYLDGILTLNGATDFWSESRRQVLAPGYKVAQFASL